MAESNDYFGSSAARAEGAEGRFAPIDSQPTITPIPGVHIQPVPGDRLLLCRVTIDPHSEAPVHTHDEEQMGIVLSGSGDFHLDGQTRQVGPGDTYHAPPGVAHGLLAGAERCTVIDVFSPPRAALMDLLPRS